MDTNNQSVFKRLRMFNLFMGGLHAIQGVLMLLLSTDFTLPVTTSFVEFDPAVQKLVSVTEPGFDLPIGPMVALFLFMSAAAHLAVSLPGGFRWYIGNLERGANYARWMEYSLSSSVMIVVIAMLAGMYDGPSLILMFALNACMILFGWVMELHNQSTEKTNWTSYNFGVFAGLVPWVVVALYLFGAGNDEFGGPPDFVYWIFFSIFLFFNVFAINMILQYKKIGPWKSYLYGERMYIVLSLVAKTLLAWQVWAGTLRPV